MTTPNSTVISTRIFGFLLGAALFFLFASVSFAATLSLSPGTGVYTAGNTFSVSVSVNTAGEPINAAEGKLSFNPSELSVVGLTKGSIFTLWAVEPSFSNSAGTVSFGGGSPSGYTGSNGTVLTITFRAKNAGTTKVNFANGSVLAADGKGTNVLTSMGNGTYTITAANVAPEPEVIEYVAPANTPAAPVVRSTTHPDPTAWYTEKNAKLSWSLPSGVTGVRTLLDQNSGSIPTKVYDSPIDQITIDDLSEGVSYFHIQFRNSEGWGRVTHYRLAVDTQNPSAFTLSLLADADLSNPTQELAYTATDATSPVRRFLIVIDGAEPVEFIDEKDTGRIVLPSLQPGYHMISVEAFDAAGNSIIDTISFTTLAFDRPQFTEYPSELNEGVIPVIKGQTRPSSTVTVTVSHLGAEPETYEINSDETGQFIFIPGSAFSRGVYELVAVATDARGAQSEPSEIIRIAVQEPGYIQVGSLIVSILSVFIPLLALLLLLIVAVWYIVYRLRRLRRRVAVESDEAAAMLEAEFGKLGELLSAERDALITSRKTRKLTKAEEHLFSSMEEAFSSAKRRVSKEISDVEALVDKQ